jgi:hypothetical protein
MSEQRKHLLNPPISTKTWRIEDSGLLLKDEWFMKHSLLCFLLF